MSKIPSDTPREPPEAGPSVQQQAVAQDLLKALGEDDLNDVTIVDTTGSSTPAMRFVLAARSPVFRRMLYGNFREAKLSQINLQYATEIVQAIVCFCVSNQLSAYFQEKKKTSDAKQLTLFVQLSQAADYLQLKQLQEMAQSRVKREMSLHPTSSVCLVLQEAALPSHLGTIAQQIIEYRPYVTLFDDTYGICCLSSDKVEAVLSNQSLQAGEWFLFSMLAKWYVANHGESTDKEGVKTILAKAREICQRHINLSFIEPSLLLNQVMSSPFVNEANVFAAVSQQALRASTRKLWKLENRGCRRDIEVDRILVEQAGSKNSNGMYYRVRSGLAKGNVLFSKRELSCGQQYVYTLTRSLKDNNQYEYRIFCNKFLTHQAVPRLGIMQSKGTIVQSFQPVLQVVQLTPPANENDATVPTPIRKYFRVRLSDGDYHMPGTLAPELNDLIDNMELIENSVLQVHEFGVYDIYGCAGIHVIRASLLTNAPLLRFGDPQPLTRDTTSKDDTVKESTTTQELKNLYTCECAVMDDKVEDPVPKSGWTVDAGKDPAPECTWLPATVSPSVSCSELDQPVQESKQQSSLQASLRRALSNL